MPRGYLGSAFATHVPILYEPYKLFYDYKDIDPHIAAIAKGVGEHKFLDEVENRYKFLIKAERKDTEAKVIKKDDWFFLINSTSGDHEKVNTFRKRLIKEGYIDCKLADFNKVFRINNNDKKKGGEQINWLKDLSHLGYLIRYMVGMVQKKESDKILTCTNHIDVIIKCFVYNGKSLLRDQLRGMHNPPKQIIVNLEKIAKSLV